MRSGTYRNKTAVLLGAFNCFNYNDLRFKLIARGEFTRHNPDVETPIHALVRSDLSRYGALPTRSIRDLFCPERPSPPNAVIFAAGVFKFARLVPQVLRAIREKLQKPTSVSYDR